MTLQFRTSKRKAAQYIVAFLIHFPLYPQSQNQNNHLLKENGKMYRSDTERDKNLSELSIWHRYLWWEENIPDIMAT